MKTYFLIWDGSELTFSGSKIQELILNDFYYESLPWYFDNIRFAPKVGDQFYLYCVDPKSEGLVGSGYIVAQPEEDEKSKKMDNWWWLGLEYLFDPTKTVCLKAEDLPFSLPKFQSTMDSATFLLDKDSKMALDKKWENYIANCPDDIFDEEKDTARRFPKQYLNIWKKNT